MPEEMPKKRISLFALGLIVLFGAFALNTVFMFLGVHGYLRELTRFSTIAGLVLTIIALLEWLVRVVRGWFKRKPE